MLNSVKAGTFVYLDPPYYPIKKTSFAEYLAGGFDHNKLADWCNETKIPFLHSNSDCEMNMKLYGSFQIEKIKCSRRINSKNPGETTDELLITNF